MSSKNPCITKYVKRKTKASLCRKLLFQATKFGDIDRVVTPLLPYLLNKVNDPSLPYFHYFFIMFHYCSCLISAKLLKFVCHLVVTLTVGHYPYVDIFYTFNGTRIPTNHSLLP